MFAERLRWRLNSTQETVLCGSQLKSETFSMVWFGKHDTLLLLLLLLLLLPTQMITLVHMDSSCLRKENNTFVFLKDFLNIFEGVIFEYA